MRGSFDGKMGGRANGWMNGMLVMEVWMKDGWLFR